MSTLTVIASLALAGTAAPASPAVPAGELRTAIATPEGVAGLHFDYIVQIVMENHAICDILTTCGGVAPYQTQLAEANGLATNYVQCGPSLPNYLCLTGASTFGCTANYPPNSNNCTAAAWNALNIVDRLEGSGLTWKAYMENMTTNCQGTSGNGYVVKHDPFVYYGDIATNATRCARVVPAGANDSALLSDLASTATASNYMWLTPNTCDDTEHCQVQVGDQYLATLVSQILNSTVFQTQRAALFITYDEASGGRGAPALYTTWAGPVARPDYASAAPYYHISELATIESNWNLTPLNANDTAAPNMDEFFVGPSGSFSLSADPFSLSFVKGQNATSVVTFQSDNNFTGNVTLAASSNRPGLTVSCSPSVIQGNESSDCVMTSSAKGSYTVTVSGSSGTLLSNVTIQVRVVDPLVVNATISPTSPFVGAVVYFNATATGGTRPYLDTWQFGDGTQASGSNVTHVYSTNATYTVNLSVQDSGGIDLPLTSNLTLAVSVAAVPPSVGTVPATAVGDVYATLQGNLQSLGGIAGVSVGFLYGTNSDLTGAANITAGNASAPEAFSQVVSGLSNRTTYYVSAWADGRGFSTGQVLNFTTRAPPLAVDFAFTPSSPGAGESVIFVGAVTGGVAPYTYAWQFGDGGAGNGATVAHAFAAGTYAVNLTVIDADSVAAVATHPVAVSPLPMVAPDVRTDAAQGIGTTNATLMGHLANLGSAASVVVGFSWARVPSLAGANNETVGALSTATAFTLSATGLTPATTYYIQAWARGEGFTAGAVLSFTTQATPILGSPVTALVAEGVAGDNGWYTSNVTVSFTAVDPQGPDVWVNFSLDGEAFARFTSPVTVGDGVHVLAYYAADAYGAQAESTHSLGVRVDSRPPQLSVESPGEVVTISTVTIRWSGSDSVSGLGSYAVQVDGGPFEPVGLATTSTLSLSDGPHAVTVRARDLAGNEVVQSVSLRVDTNVFSPTGPLQGMPTYELIAVVLGSGLVLFLERRRRSRAKGRRSQ